MKSNKTQTDRHATLLSNTVRSPLKWPGGKRRVLPHILDALPMSSSSRLVEPFVGGGSVFLNVQCDSYLLCDTNPDLIHFYKTIKRAPHKFIRAAATYFSPQYNNADTYYELRQRFNLLDDPFEKSVLFLYLNRHGFNGLCRYNSKGGYNVPFGRYKKPYFPQQEILFTANKLKQATLLCADFATTFNHTQRGDVVYCDPPYTPITATASFTAYAGNSFDMTEQQRLVEACFAVRKQGISSLISNHDLNVTRALYTGANEIKEFSVQRHISQNGEKRVRVKELIAIYHGQSTATTA